MNKEFFVKQYLQPLMQNLEINVKSVDYFLYENNEEFIIITYLNEYQKKKCVTADSLKALVVDALRD